MPRGQNLSSSSRYMYSYHCEYCDRIFTFKNKRLACKVVSMHSKKCNGSIAPAKHSNFKSEQMKKHCKNLMSSLNMVSIKDNVLIIE